MKKAVAVKRFKQLAADIRTVITPYEGFVTVELTAAQWQALQEMISPPVRGDSAFASPTRP